MSRNQRTGKHVESVDHARFLEMLTAEFPEVPQAFDGYGKGLLHCEMGVFARLTEEAMDCGAILVGPQLLQFR